MLCKMCALEDCREQVATDKNVQLMQRICTNVSPEANHFTGYMYLQPRYLYLVNVQVVSYKSGNNANECYTAAQLTVTL